MLNVDNDCTHHDIREVCLSFRRNIGIFGAKLEKLENKIMKKKNKNK